MCNLNECETRKCLRAIDDDLIMAAIRGDARMHLAAPTDDASAYPSALQGRRRGAQYDG